MSAKNLIYGFPCFVQSPKLRQAIRFVLKQIRTRAPEDFKRIQRRVIRFADRSSTSGWKKQTMARFSNFLGYGIIFFSEKIRPEDLKLTVAHELGHACERPRDYRRHQVKSNLIREFIADDYSDKWGFGHIIRPGEHVFVGPIVKAPSSQTRNRVQRTTRSVSQDHA